MVGWSLTIAIFIVEVTHLCACNDPCTGDQEVCTDNDPGKEPVCKIGNPSSGNAFTVVFEENDTEKSFREVSCQLLLYHPCHQQRIIIYHCFFTMVTIIDNYYSQMIVIEISYYY